MTRRVWTFWYGSYMNPAVLAVWYLERLEGFVCR